MLKKDNTYTDGSWLSTGEFFVEENTVVMVGPLDGTHKLKIEQEDGQMILCYYDRDSEIPRTFYKSADQAQTARDVRKEAERIAAEEQAAAELKELEDSLIGYWYTDSRSPIEFTQDGLYIEYTADGIQQGKYQVSNWTMIVTQKLSHWLCPQTCFLVNGMLRPTMKEIQVENILTMEPMRLKAYFPNMYLIPSSTIP